MNYIELIIFRENLINSKVRLKKKIEEFTSEDPSRNRTEQRSHFSKLWALCIILSITFSTEVCSSNRS